ncbi:lytic polysaccharide monooxygenase [Zasmidium cellare ATCC 36951]|uniref:Lytic polysaccharide monooxygenase n=1 Tax=Zasmidium cellare ATCC 36951 TaxID=1080233 RepID=A0A6A6C8M9_ZASCE|nr:lytic polysaccharide monooxygenase [Zasmidium cellare ATCC 36951]KAF2161786.1 lytic polysaccharide monooxygenase [Zasmidium cellare ATCC 36951]
MSSVGSLATLALCFGSTFVAGHMIMQNPVPFGKETLNNSPLVDTAIGSSQSDFPCKQRAGVYKIDTINKYQVESPIELNFTGSASHGGGTCQISITRDLEPTAKSDFRVIQTFSGGCPTAQDGNSGSTDFSFKIPKGFPNGRATLAWTWYNKIGNREIYMNCAPLDISGGSSDTTVFDSLPHQYIINLPTTGSDYCKSADSADVLIPDPGQYNTKAPTAKLEAPTGPGCAAAAKAITNGVSSGSGSSGSSGSGSAGSSAPSAGGSSNQSAAPSSGDSQAPASSSASQPSASSDSAASQSGFATVTTVGSGAAASESAASTPAESSSYPTMSVPSDAGVSGPASTGFAAAPTGTGSSSSGSGSSGGSDGSLVCNGTDQFGLMNNGKVVWQPVAAGTKCVNGQIQKRSDSRHAHVRRHAAKDF